MADKKLNITADLKVRTQEAEKALKRLEREGMSTGKAMSGLKMGTRHGDAMYAKGIITATKEMQKFRGVTQDTAKVMEFSYGRQLEKETKRVDNLKTRIAHLNVELKKQTESLKLASELGLPEVKGARFGRMREVVRTSREVRSLNQERESREEELRKLRGDDNTPKQKSFAEQAQVAGIAAQVIGSLLKQGGTLAQSLKNIESGNMANIMQHGAGSVMQRTLNGDFGMGLAMVSGPRKAREFRDGLKGFAPIITEKDYWRRDISTQSTTMGFGESLNEADGLKANLTSGFGDMLERGGKAVTAAATLGGAGGNEGRDGYMLLNGGQAAGAGMGVLGAMADMQNGGPLVKELATVMERIQDEEQMRPYEQAAMRQLAGTAGARVHASRRMQGGSHNAMFLGGEYGLDQIQSLQFGTQIADQFGSSHVPAIMKQALEAEKKGFDRNAVSQILGRANEAAGSEKAGEELLVRIMSRGVANGMKDVQLHEKIAIAVSQGMVSATGGRLADSGAFSDMLTKGIGNNKLDVEDRLGAVAANDQLFRGNSFFHAQGIGMARNILGKDASMFTVSALANASTQDLLSEGSYLRDAGISAEQQRSMAQNRLMAPLLPLLSKKDPFGRMLLDGAEQYGGSIPKYLAANPDAIKKGRVLMKEGLEGFTPETAEQHLRMLADSENIGRGGGASFDTKGLLEDKTDKNAIEYQKAVAEAHNKILAVEINLREKIVQGMKAQLDVFQKSSGIEPSLAAGHEFITIMKDVTALFERAAAAGAIITVNSNGGVPASVPPPQPPNRSVP